MRFPANARLGPYEILGPLGKGGMGEVYRARDPRLDREVAIKVLPPDVSSSPERLARFEREAKALARLNHPNIVTIHSVEDSDGVRFLTMELIEGQTLSTEVTPGGLPRSRWHDLSLQLAEALAAAHERGVIHRDLKPGNVMVTRDGKVKVLDFGLARPEALSVDASHGTTAEGPITIDGGVVGTLPYMAPEMLRGESVDARSDVFALGIILYELASGHRPFTGATPAVLGSSILRDTPRPLTDVRKDLPGSLVRLVERCLEKSPGARPSSARDVWKELRAVSEGPPPAPSGRQAHEAVASVAVLPFANRAAGTEDEYFSDGLADELLNVLAKIPGLRVPARASSFYFKNKGLPLREIGEALNVATVLDGSVQKAGNRIRISVQLVGVSSGNPIWSERYDRTLDDIFAVQDEIAQSVVKELRAALLGGASDTDATGGAKVDVARATKGRSADPEAYRLYLLARHLLDRATREYVGKGLEHLKHALTLDPTFPLAWVEMSRAYMNEAGFGWAPVAEAMERSRDAVERALALEPDLAEGLVRLGWIQMSYDWDWRGADTSVSRALALAPGNPMILRAASSVARVKGRLEEAAGLCRRAMEQDPLSAVSYHNFGVAAHDAGHYAEAEAAFRRVLELTPQKASTRATLALALLAQGRRTEALEEASREPEDAYRLWALGIIHHMLGRRAESDEAVRDLTEHHGTTMAAQIAEVLGARGDADAAFEWFDRARAQRDIGLPYVLGSPRLRPLHNDPRWSAFLREMKLDVLIG